MHPMRHLLSTEQFNMDQVKDKFLERLAIMEKDKKIILSNEERDKVIQWPPHVFVQLQNWFHFYQV